MNILQQMLKANNPATTPLEHIRQGLPLPTGQFINEQSLSDEEKARLSSLGVPDVTAAPAQMADILNEIAKEADTFVPSLKDKGMTQAQIREQLARGTKQLPPEEAAAVQSVIKDYYEQNKQAAAQTKTSSVLENIPNLEQEQANRAVYYETDEPAEGLPENEPLVNPTTTAQAKPKIEITDEDLTSFVMSMASSQRFKKTYTTHVANVRVEVTLREMLTEDVFYINAAIRKDYEAKVVVSAADLEAAKRLYLLVSQLDALTIGAERVQLLEELSQLDALGIDTPPFTRLRQLVNNSVLRRETIANIVQDLIAKFVPYTAALAKRVYSPN